MEWSMGFGSQADRQGEGNVEKRKRDTEYRPLLPTRERYLKERRVFD